MFMDPEHVISLLDTYWFSYEILKRKPNVWRAKTDISEPKFSSLRSILVRSQSEDIGSSFNYGLNSFFSPNSVLKTIPSGKLDFTTQKQEQDQVVEEVEEVLETAKVNDNQMESKQKKKRRHGTSKSLSDLEFEELKGFMDMGFVFSEQDSKDSSLVEIIPGLQRLGEERERDQDDDDNDNDDDGDDDDDDDDDERRPYLSEAWEALDRKKEAQKMIKWEIPVAKDEIDMKDNLKLWAHTVASIVR